MSYITPLLILVSFAILVIPALIIGRLYIKFSAPETDVIYGYLISFGFLTILLLNANQFFPLGQLFLLFILLSAIIVYKGLYALGKEDVHSLFNDLKELLILATVVIASVFFYYRMDQYWILEGANNDALVYYEGLHWSLKSKLFINSSAVDSAWGLGRCGDGGGLWIGYDCPLYRGGVYTIAAWFSFLAPVKSPDLVFFLMLYGVIPCWLMAQMILNVAKNPNNHQENSLIERFYLAVIFLGSTSIVGALINSNLASMLAGIVFALVYTLLLQIKYTIKNILFGIVLWSGIAVHFYGELIFYISPLFVLWVIAIRSQNIFNKEFTIRNLLIALLIFVLISNLPLAMALKTFLFLVGNTSEMEWFSWYIKNNPIYWLGGFLTGILMGVGVSTILVKIATIMMGVSAVILLVNKKSRYGFGSLLITSVLFVFYVELKNYQYGEHKILQILGLAWLISLVYSILIGYHHLINLKHFKIKYNKIFPLFYLIILLGLAAVINLDFGIKSYALLGNQIGVHGVEKGVDRLISKIRPGTTVLIDDINWRGKEKFQKTQYILFEISRIGANPVLPKIDNNLFRAGYYPNNKNNTFKNSGKIDYLIKSKGRTDSYNIFQNYTGDLIYETRDYQLWRLIDSPVVVQADNWYDCELNHCWTMSNFEIELLTSVDQKNDLTLYFKAYKPTENGLIIVRNNKGEIVGEFSAHADEIVLRLPRGWSRLNFEPNWTISSPLELGLSNDSRKLFLSINAIKIK